MPTESPKYQEAERRVPLELRPVFHRLVKEYEFLTALSYGRGYVAYQVLDEVPAHHNAELPLNGSPDWTASPEIYRN